MAGKKILEDPEQYDPLAGIADIEGAVRSIIPRANIRLQNPTGEDNPGGPSLAGIRAATKALAKGKESGNFTLKPEPRAAGRSTPKGDRVKAGDYDPYNARDPKAERTAPKKTVEEQMDIRHVDQAEAIRRARKGEHLVPKEGGGFKGAPEQAQDMADIRRLRRQFDKDVGLGGGGADWYQRTHEWITQVAGPDPAAQSRLARNLALFSAQADPKGNLGFSLAAHNAAISGKPLGKVRTGAQAREFNRSFEEAQAAKDEGTNLMDPEARSMMGHNRFQHAPWEISLGKKTGIFGEHMDPTRENPTTGTNDIWHARALGYEKDGKPWDSRLSPTQHRYMDYETVLAVDRANKKNLLGRDDWTPGEIQAAPWVYRKAKGLQERFPNKYPTLDAAMAEARKTYPEYAPEFTAGATHEVIPGETTGHLPDIVGGGREARDEYSGDPRYWWTREGDPGDILYRSQDVLNEPTTPHTGIFGDKVNMGQTAHPLLSFKGGSSKKTLDDPSQQFLSGTEAFRSFANAQDAGAGSMFIGNQPVGRQSGYALNLPGGGERDVLAAKLIANEQGLGDVVHHGGNRAIATTFGENGPEAEVGARASKRIAEAFGQGGIEAKPGRVESTYQGHDWSQPGQGIASKGMLDRLSEPQMEAFGKPEVRNVVRDINQADMEKAATGGGVREDIVNSRALLEQGGPEQLRQAVAILQSGGLPALQHALKIGALGVGVLLPFIGAGLAGEQDDQRR